MTTSGRQNHRSNSGRPQFGDMTVGDYANGMPSIRIGEMFRSLLRQLLWLVPLMAMAAIIAWFATSNFKRTYQGEGRVMVQLGVEHTFNPASGQNNQALMLTSDVITLTEASIMNNPEVIQVVIDEMKAKFGEQRFAPEAFAKINAAIESRDPLKLTNANENLHKTISKAFVVSPLPKSNIIDLSFKHEDGDVAVAGLNAFIQAYLDHRRKLFVEGAAGDISERLNATEEQINTNAREIQTFLSRNNIADFDSERTGASRRAEQIRAEMNALKAQLTETEAALAAVEGQLRQTPAEINLYIDDRATQRIAQAELELKNLLSRYLPNSDPVKAKQAEIAQYKALQSSNSGAAIGGRRVGPNPTYQALMTRRNLLQSTADSYREKEFTLQRQLNAADAKVRKLQKLLPEYESLLREKSTLDLRHSGYTAKEQEALINQQQLESSSENIKVVSWATLPRKGRNMRMIMFALVTMGIWMTLGLIALLKVFLDPRLYGTPTQYGYGTDDYEAYGYETIRPAYHTTPDNYVPEPVGTSQYAPPASPAASSFAYVGPDMDDISGPMDYAVPYEAPGSSAPPPPMPAQSVAAAQFQQPQPYHPSQNPYGGAMAADTAVPVIGTVPSSEEA